MSAGCRLSQISCLARWQQACEAASARYIDRLVQHILCKHVICCHACQILLRGIVETCAGQVANPCIFAGSKGSITVVWDLFMPPVIAGGNRAYTCEEKLKVLNNSVSACCLHCSRTDFSRRVYLDYSKHALVWYPLKGNRVLQLPV